MTGCSSEVFILHSTFNEAAAKQVLQQSKDAHINNVEYQYPINNFTTMMTMTMMTITEDTSEEHMEAQDICKRRVFDGVCLLDQRSLVFFGAVVENEGVFGYQVEFEDG